MIFPLHLHPMLVHFPIALFITSLGFAVGGRLFNHQGLKQSAVYLYIAAVLLTPVVVQTGLWEAQGLDVHHPVFSRHQNFAFVSMYISVASLFFLWFIKMKYPKLFSSIFFLIILGIVSLIGITAYYGGRLVFEYGVGIDQ